MWRTKHQQCRRKSRTSRLDTKKRNLGGMEFIDLRDEFGITQIIINDEKLQEQTKNSQQKAVYM